MVNVYVACTLRDKKLLWEELLSIKAAFQEPVGLRVTNQARLKVLIASLIQTFY